MIHYNKFQIDMICVLTSQASPEKQNQQAVYVHTEIYFQKLTHALWSIVKSKI